MCKPIVPEVSIILENTNSTASNQTPPPKNYKEWKKQQHTLQQQTIKQYQMQTENFRPNNNEPLGKKKFVKFDLPTPEAVTPIEIKTVSTPLPVNSLGMATCPQLDLSCIESARPSNSQNIQNYPQYQNIPIQHQPDRSSQWAKSETNPTSNISNLEEMYRQMSLQQMNAQYKGQNDAQENKLFEQMPKQSNQEITLDDVYQLLQAKLNQSPSAAVAPQPQYTNDMNSWSRQQGNNNNFEQNRQPLATIPQQSSEMNIIRTQNAEPSMKDLFNIILKQQEQLMNIQQQVHALLLNSTNGSTPAIAPQIESNQIFDRTEYKQFSNSRANPIGVMTSLEINVQQLKPCSKPECETVPNEMNSAINSNNAIKQCGCSCQCENKNIDQPMMIQSSDSESNDDNSDCFSKQGDKKTGWTFYGNILNQVNNVLQNTSPENPNREKIINQPFNKTNDADIQSNNNNNVNNCNYNVRPNIRSTQIKQFGLHFDDVNISAMAKRYCHAAHFLYFNKY